MTISRRHLIASAPLAFAALGMGKAFAAGRESWDMIVVGAGTAGIPAAIFAAERGARVLLLEKSSQLGGTLWFSGGQMSAAGTRRQQALGIADSPENHFNDIMRISRGTAEPALVRRAVQEAAGTLDWLEASGFIFDTQYPLDATGHEPYSARRVWGGKERGISLLKLLETELAKLSNKPVIRTDFEVQELLLDASGNVAGVRGQDDGGQTHDFRASQVILASGGYMSNPSMFADLNGIPQYRAGWAPANNGIGVTLALSAGGHIRGKQNYLCDFGSIPMDTESPSSEFARSIHHPQRRLPWEIWVNAKGQRFVSEEEPSVDVRERALLGQPDHRYWIVFDEEVLSSSPMLVRSAPPGESRDWTIDELRASFGDIPAFVKGDTIDELAERAGIAAEGLRATIEQYNRAAQSGSDAFGRKHIPRPIAKPPYYAIRHQGGTLISMAGVAVDGDLRVIKPSGQAVGGLFAAGELLGNGSLSGQAFCSGMMVTPALSLGRWLGRTLPLG